MPNLIVPFNGNSEKEVDDTPLTTFIGWDRARKVLEITSIDLDENEEVAGFVIDNTGIIIKLKTK